MSEASDLRRTPLHAEHVALGARLVPFAGYEMPVQYEGILAEHRAVRGAAGLFDLSHMGEIEVRGEEAVAFLRYALVSDPGALSVGQAQYSMMCEADGGIVDDLIVYRLDEQRLWIVCNASNRATVVEQLHRLLERGDFGAEVDDRSDRIALIAPQGPTGGRAARRPHRRRSGRASRTTTPPRGRWPGSTASSRAPATPARTGSSSSATRGALPTCGVRCSTPARRLGLVPCGLGSRDTLRLEAGMPLYGNELDRETNPFEVNLGRVVKLEKGEFVGRAALQAVQQAGPERKLVGLRMIDDAIPRAGYEVRAEGLPAGRVTSGTQSPTLGTRIAMALVPAERAEIGGELEVVVRDRPQRAEQVKLPFYRRPRD